MDCIFCKIIAGDIPADLLYEDDALIVLRDINPQAPEHLLVIPKKHIATINDASTEDSLLLGKMILQAQTSIKQYASEGYRLIFNVNNMGGQTVYHIHLHVLAGRRLNWPPG
jgi:histidine triad (HIT) family protein